MSVGYLDTICNRLRLLARANCTCDDNGTLISGAIIPDIEQLRIQISELIDQLLDGHPLSDLQKRVIERGIAVIDFNRPIVKQLELQFA